MEENRDSDMAIENLLDLANDADDGTLDLQHHDIASTIRNNTGAIENRIIELEKTDRDTTNSCSQCETYIKRIEELEAEVEQWRTTCENDDWANLKREQKLKAAVEKLTIDVATQIHETTEWVRRYDRLQTLHNSSMSATVAGELLKHLIAIKHKKNRLLDYDLQRTIADFTDKEASDE